MNSVLHHARQRSSAPSKDRSGQSTRTSTSTSTMERTDYAFKAAQKLVFVISYLNYASFYFARKPFSVVKKAMGDDLGFTTAELGTIDTAFLVMYALGQFVLPQLGDKLGVCVCVCVCVCACVCMCVCWSVAVYPLRWWHRDACPSRGQYITGVQTCYHILLNQLT